jgi:apolipoprotein N-acyltransferase
MRSFRPDRTLVWSFLSGILLALSFPRPDLWFVAWFAMVPLLLVAASRPFASGFTAGIGFFALVLYWLNIVMTTYGKLHPFLSVVAYLLLVGYLALFFGAATWAAWRLRQRLGIPMFVSLPVLWVACEFLRSFLLTGFPWATLGYSQQGQLPIVQSADLFGVYGISFLLLLTNAVLAEIVRAGREGRLRAAPWPAAVVAMALVAANIGYGAWRLGQDLDRREKMLRVGLVQGNIDQGVKWDPGHQQTTVDLYADLSVDARGRGALDLLIWPESATPFYFQDDTPLREKVVAVPRRTGTPLLFGSPAYERAGSGFKFLNSAFVLTSGGEVLGRSDKVHLVPFGEYVPLAPLLPFIDKLVVGIGDFSPGKITPLPLDGGQVGVLVCFEGIFPELARDFVRKGSDLLVNITNDAWFGRSSAPHQHLGMTRFRAVENRIWVARAANTGISAIIAPSGRITVSTPLFEALAVTGEVGMGARPTLYNRFGDTVPAFFLGLSLLGLLWTCRRRASRP